MPPKGFRHSVIDLPQFIQATRDSGYKSTTSAVAELVDNSIQAGAKEIRVLISEDGKRPDLPTTLQVVDNGCGMAPTVLRNALRFGGSTRFGSRDGLGRFGMGLPNASLSQSRRVDVITWTRPTTAWSSYLDVDEIAAGRLEEVPQPTRVPVPLHVESPRLGSGTVVSWPACDRLDNQRISTLVRKLQSALGRVFRHYIWRGVSITLNGAPVAGLDPLFLHPQAPLVGASLFGEVLTFQVRVSPQERRTGTVRATFSELPIEQWADLPTPEKRTRGIANGAGVSVVRSGREIDYGWFLMGQKRRENYDDWWRCEVQFDPVLDEAFGITHTKQQIRPQEHLIEAVGAELEEIAKVLNGRARQRYGRVKAAAHTAPMELKLERRDRELPTIPARRRLDRDDSALARLEVKHVSIGRNGAADSESTQYRVVEEDRADDAFFTTLVDNGRVVIVLNSKHPFCRKYYRRILKGDSLPPEDIAAMLHALLLSAGRAEAMASRRAEIDTLVAYRKHWGQALGLLLHG